MALFEYLKDKVYPIYLTVRKDETTIRCPICGDSTKSNMSAHCYIKNSAPFPYYCHKCSSHGFVDDKFLLKLNTYDAKMNSYLSASYNDYLKTLNKKYGSSMRDYINQKELIIMPNNMGELETKKLEYISNRFGRKLNKQDIQDFRIILNLLDFYNNNKIDISKFDARKLNQLDNLNSNYVMFLLNDKNMINCRNMNPTNKKDKFHKLRIFDDTKDQSRRFFSIKNDIDISSRVFTINMTEGIFDIASIFFNLNNGIKKDNELYIANNGTGYLFPLEYLQSMGILNANINIYSDSDVSLDDLRKKLKYNRLIKFNNANVFYNQYAKDGIKDFGVDKDKIIVSPPNLLF